MHNLRVEVTRGELVESVHHVAGCAMDAKGSIMWSAGEIDAPVYLRSSAKPFIAAAAIAAGVREAFDLQPNEIAVMAASHTGQTFHTGAVRSILRKIGMNESALQCGAHAPYNAAAAQELAASGREPGAIHNNCSGKHAGILALARSIGADPRTYMEMSNPAQQRILNLCARMSDRRIEDLPMGVDGCGIPVYAVSLRHATLAFMRFATLEGIGDDDARALRVVRDAMIAHPEYVSGDGEFDTCLMQAAGGAIVCKGGAEGVHASSLLAPGTGVVVKVIDGASRGRAPAVLGTLRGMGLLDEAALAKLAAFERPIVYNRAGRAVGEIRASES